MEKIVKYLIPYIDSYLKLCYSHNIHKEEITDIHSITAKDNILDLEEKTDYCYYYAFSGVFN